MFFYIDESGNTGKNLFDLDQKNLYYGLISSKLNIDILAKRYFNEMKTKFGINHLHGKSLSLNKIISIAPDLLLLQKKLKFQFNLFSIVKRDHALISFFDQIFDQGVNPAYSWTGYWTPLRYIMLLKLATLFDTEMLKQAWNARITLDPLAAEKIIIDLCNTLLKKLHKIPDERSRQLIGDTLQWAQKNYSKLNYNAVNKESILQITPNLIGFQFVLQHIAYNISKHGKQPNKIIVDKQIEFNKSQSNLADYYATLKRHSAIMSIGPGLPELDCRHMPTVPLLASSSKQSHGLEVVDIFLWVFQRFLEKKNLPEELIQIIQKNINKTYFSELSIKSIESRATEWITNLPYLTEEQIEASKKRAPFDEERRLKAVKLIKD